VVGYSATTSLCIITKFGSEKVGEITGKQKGLLSYVPCSLCHVQHKGKEVT